MSRSLRALLTLASLLGSASALRARFYNTTGCAQAFDGPSYTFDYLEQETGGDSLWQQGTGGFDPFAGCNVIGGPLLGGEQESPVASCALYSHDRSTPQDCHYTFQDPFKALSFGIMDNATPPGSWCAMYSSANCDSYQEWTEIHIAESGC